jgi:hypothetical protein
MIVERRRPGRPMATAQGTFMNSTPSNTAHAILMREYGAPEVLTYAEVRTAMASRRRLSEVNR